MSRSTLVYIRLFPQTVVCSGSACCSTEIRKMNADGLRLTLNYDYE